MAKPAITKRQTKGSALTYTELDTNFQNLADATLSLTAGSGGTQVTSDLNGNITLVAGTGITLSGNNTAKTITITNTGSSVDLTSSDLVNLGQNDNDIFQFQLTDPDKPFQIFTNYTGTSSSLLLGTTNGSNNSTILQHGTSNGNLQILSTSSDILIKTANTLPSGVINLEAPLVKITHPGSTNGIINFKAGVDDAAAIAQIYTNDQRDLQLTNSVHGIDLYNNTTGMGIALTAPGKDSYVQVQSGILRLNPITTAERDAITSPQNGSLIYNSTTGKFQGRAAGAWVDLH